jgi:hypothetical protein
LYFVLTNILKLSIFIVAVLHLVKHIHTAKKETTDGMLNRSLLGAANRKDLSRTTERKENPREHDEEVAKS